MGKENNRDGIHRETSQAKDQESDFFSNYQSPRLIKKDSCSNQLRLKFKMLIIIKISRNSAFYSGSDKPRMLFFLLINVKMPTTV